MEKISFEDYSALILPDLGGALGCLHWRGIALTQAYDASRLGRGDPARVGMFPMTPFAGRIENARFEWRDGLHQVSRPPGEPHGLHGDGWLSTWAVIGQTRETIELEHCGDCGALAYRATLFYGLDAEGLKVSLTLRSDARHPLPFGLGFHPWFARRPGARVCFQAQRFWLEAPGGFPSTSISLPQELDFAQGAPIPSTWRNNVYEGWHRRLAITYPDLNLKISMQASANLNWLMVYANPELDYICFEPQSHRPAAHNSPGRGPRYGLMELMPGETLTGEVHISAHSLLATH
ncbi:aldose 1-epimerase [Caulobacter sp. X]|uniref:aldose 1-epimerase n=1 Tax=Caulobacter sp. X TaxID=2048901 RepID=UPI000C1590FF|nr:aldose 1-epimerase [Caulobacter sp. X]PIB95228.1 hypothetical protein CSW60_21990 [Caulobacter sp. X]